MYQKRTRILGGIAIFTLLVICCGMYGRSQQKKAAYAYELLKVKAALEQMIQYSDDGVDMTVREELNEEYAGLVNVTSLDRSVSKIALLYGKDGALGSDILKLADHLNGVYPDLTDQNKLTWLERIREASQIFLQTLEQTENISINDFITAVRDFSEVLPTYAEEQFA